MIELQNVTKTFVLNGNRKMVANNISFTFPDRKAVALLGGNGAGKSTMLRMIAGSVTPEEGRIIRRGAVSWPVGYAGSFHNDLTGAQNVAFVARVYGIDTDEMVDFTKDFSELGSHFHLPVRSYSSGMKSRLAFAMSMAVPFDTYLIDEITAVGDKSFKAKSQAMLDQRLQHAGAIIVSHSMEELRRLCESGVVLQNARFFYYARVERAIEHYNHMMNGALPPWMRPGGQAGPLKVQNA